MLLIVKISTRFPSSGRMFMAHLHRWALAFLGSGFGGSYANRRRLTRRRQPVTRHRVAGSGEIPLPQNSGRSSSCAAALGSAHA